MKRTLPLFFLFLAQFIYLDCVSQSASCSYGYRKRITFNPAQVAGPVDLTNFPVIINITSDNDLRTTANSGHVQSSSGFDIVFTDEDGVTLLNHQLMGYSATTGSLQCWIKIPNLSTSLNTCIYMYYGNSATTTDQSSSATWSNGYVGVWHFDNSLNNSTGTTGLNGTNNNTTNTATSKFGQARDFVSASSQYIEVTPYNSAYDLTGNVTVSAWIRIGSTGADQKILGNQNNANGGWKFGVFSDNKIEFEIRTSGNASTLSRSASGGVTLGTGTWYYVVGQYSDAGDFINTYLNGVVDRTLSTTAVLGTSSGTMKFGREPFSSGAFLNGIEDEVRLSNVIRSADWIATEYNNQNSPNPGTFYTITSEPNIFTAASNNNWNNNANWSSGSVPTASTDVIISANCNMNTSIQVNSIWIRPSVTFNLNSGQVLSVLSDVTNCGSISGSNSNSLLQMNGNSAYSQTQYLSGNGSYTLRDLTINNTHSVNPSVVLMKDVDVVNDLVLTSGVVVTTSTNILALGTGATSTGGSSTSYVSGPMSKDGTAAFIFPVGKGGLWRRVRVSGISGGNTEWRAEYINSAHTSTSPVSSPMDNVSTMEYWQLDKINGTGSANVSLYWEDAAYSGINNCADLTIARWTGSTWSEQAATFVTGSSCTGSGTGTITTNAAISGFSPFTFGSKSTTLNPLPVTLLEFKSECLEKGVLLKWTSASEKNNDHYEVERSYNGEHWQLLDRVRGAINSSHYLHYEYLDASSTDKDNYYRLSQVDSDGKKTVFQTLNPACDSRNDSWRLYPNPANKELSFELNLSQNYGSGTLKFVDALGRIVYQSDVTLIKGKSVTTKYFELLPGTYSVICSSEKLVLPSYKLVVE